MTKQMSAKKICRFYANACEGFFLGLQTVWQKIEKEVIDLLQQLAPKFATAVFFFTDGSNCETIMMQRKFKNHIHMSCRCRRSAKSCKRREIEVKLDVKTRWCQHAKGQQKKTRKTAAHHCNKCLCSFSEPIYGSLWWSRS